MVSILYNISPLPSIAVFVKFNRWLFPRRSALFKRARTKILLYFHESKGKELQKHAFILNLSLWSNKNFIKKAAPLNLRNGSSSSFPNFQALLDQLPFPVLFHPPAHFSLTFYDDSEINVPLFCRPVIFPRRFRRHAILTNA